MLCSVYAARIAAPVGRQLRNDVLDHSQSFYAIPELGQRALLDLRAECASWLAAGKTLAKRTRTDAIAATLLQYPIFKSRTAHAPSDTFSPSRLISSRTHRSESSGAKIKLPISNST